MNISTLLGLVVIAILTWKAIDVGWAGWRGLRIILGAKNRRAVDVSSTPAAPSGREREIIGFLLSMGFRRLGEAGVTFPDRQMARVWVLVNPEGTVQAEVRGGMASFSTVFQGDALVVTDYPSGEHIEAPTYQSHTITTGLDDAYQHHLQQVDKFTQKYGTPRQIQTMADYLHLDALGRERNYGAIKMRRYRWLEVFNLVTFVYVALVMIFLPAMMRAQQVVTTATEHYSLLERTELLIIGLTFPMLTLQAMITRQVVRKSHRDSRGR